MLQEHTDVDGQHREWLTRVALGALRAEPSYGHVMMERLEDFGLHQGEVSAGTLYRTLKRLEKEGLCNAEWGEIPENGGPGCRMHSVSEAGEEYLRVLVGGSA